MTLILLCVISEGTFELKMAINYAFVTFDIGYGIILIICANMLIIIAPYILF